MEPKIQLIFFLMSKSTFFLIKYYLKTDALRRKHIYDEFIVTYLKTLNENGKLAEIVRNNGFMSTGNSTIINLNKSKNSPIFLQQQHSTTKRRKK